MKGSAISGGLMTLVLGRKYDHEVGLHLITQVFPSPPLLITGSMFCDAPSGHILRLQASISFC